MGETVAVSLQSVFDPTIRRFCFMARDAGMPFAFEELTRGHLFEAKIALVFDSLEE